MLIFFTIVFSLKVLLSFVRFIIYWVHCWNRRYSAPRKENRFWKKAQNADFVVQPSIVPIKVSIWNYRPIGYITLVVLISPTSQNFGQDMPFNYCPKIQKSQSLLFFGHFGSPAPFCMMLMSRIWEYENFRDMTNIFIGYEPLTIRIMEFGS